MLLLDPRVFSPPSFNFRWVFYLFISSFDVHPGPAGVLSGSCGERVGEAPGAASAWLEGE